MRRPPLRAYAWGVTARELLEANGDFRHSPLLETARRLHAAFSRAGVDYAIVGGLAVARNGAVRTTQDVDVLTERAGWPKVMQQAAADFDFGVDKAMDRASGIEVDFVFAGEDWGLPFALPRPSAVSELDDDLGARFMDLEHLLELKCAVYLSKKAHEGMELAAKDLADVVHLMQANASRVGEPLFAAVHPAVRDELARIWRSIKGKAGRGKGRGP